MFYTTEEAAVLCGFLDYIWATKALSFLRPHWWQDYEDQRALENALLKTQTLALKTKN